MAIGRASAQGRTTARVRKPHGRYVSPELASSPSDPVRSGPVPAVAQPPVPEAAHRPAPDVMQASEPDLVRASAHDDAQPTEPTDDELDARARVVLASMPPLGQLVEDRVPLTLIADLLSPFGPSSERIAREERDA